MSTKRNQHYNFTYFVLPHMVFEDTDNTYNNLFDDNRESYIKKIWRELGDATGEYLPDAGLSIEKISLMKNEDLFIIELPVANENLEAIFVGIVFYPIQGGNSIQSSTPRLFTLELGIDANSNFDQYFLGETLPGKNKIKYDHINYGLTISKDKDAFSKSIQKIISAQRTPGKGNMDLNEPFRAEKNPENNHLEQEELQQILDNIWKKWGSINICDDINSLLNKAFTPLIEEFDKMVSDFMEYGNYSAEFNEEIKEGVNTQIAYLYKISLLIGLNYPTYDRDSDLFKKQIQFLLLMEASETIKKYLAILCGELKKRRKISNEDIDQIACRIGSKLNRFLISGFVIGTKSCVNKAGTLIVDTH